MAARQAELRLQGRLLLKTPDRNLTDARPPGRVDACETRDRLDADRVQPFDLVAADIGDETQMIVVLPAALAVALVSA